MLQNPAFLEAYFLNDEENVSSFEPAQIFGPNIEIPGLSHDLQHFSYNPQLFQAWRMHKFINFKTDHDCVSMMNLMEFTIVCLKTTNFYLIWSVFGQLIQTSTKL